ADGTAGEGPVPAAGAIPPPQTERPCVGAPRRRQRPAVFARPGTALLLRGQELASVVGGSVLEPDTGGEMAPSASSSGPGVGLASFFPDTALPPRPAVGPGVAGRQKGGPGEQVGEFAERPDLFGEPFCGSISGGSVR